jgi:4-hydroxybenzoate polyprenyltransferase
VDKYKSMELMKTNSDTSTLEPDIKIESLTISASTEIISESSSTSSKNYFLTILSNIKYFILSLRLYQWSKNLLVFAALIFAGQLFNIELLTKSILIFFLFSLVAGIVYVWNDVMDMDEDKLHPTKKFRPLASGKITPTVALVLSSFVLSTSLFVSYFISISLTIFLIAYIILNFFYSLKLKHVVILDILIVAVGYVLRAVAGGFVIQVEISPWLLVCTFFLALFLVVGKRRAELSQLKKNSPTFRPILLEYNSHILDQMIGVVTAATILGYALYTLDGQTVAKFGTYNLIYTVPFVVYGIFRYFYLIYKKDLGGSPESILIKDKHILVNVFFWIVTVIFIIYWK